MPDSRLNCRPLTKGRLSFPSQRSGKCVTNPTRSLFGCQPQTRLEGPNDDKTSSLSSCGCSYRAPGGPMSSEEPNHIANKQTYLLTRDFVFVRTKKRPEQRATPRRGHPQRGPAIVSVRIDHPAHGPRPTRRHGRRRPLSTTALVVQRFDRRWGGFWGGYLQDRQFAPCFAARVHVPSWVF
jgi:hypothetical protein